MPNSASSEHEDEQPEQQITVGVDGFELPVVELLTGRGFITGKSGSGKSNSASVVVEELLEGGFPVLIVDTDGEYYGLKEQYEMLHVGADEECDLQVGPEHAEKLAELALDQNVPIILDVSGYLDESDADDLIRETSRQLFVKEKKLKKPFLMVIEECHEYIPESGSIDDTGQMLVKIGKRGRKHGLGIVGVSQRPADVKKDFITQANWLVWHRLTWDNDTKVVGRVLGNDYKDPVQELADGEAFVMVDWEGDIRRVQWSRKRTFDAGATPGLEDFERPELKSVSGDLVGELEEISTRQQRKQDRVSQLENRVETLQEEKQALEDELESARDMQNLAEQMAEGLRQHDGNGGVASKKVDELVEERNELRSQVEQREDQIDELQSTVSELERELEQRPDISENAVEAVERLAEEFGVGGSDTEALRRKLKSARERIDELENATPTTDDLEADPLDNRKVQSVVRDVESRLSDLGDKERQMLRYYLVSGPCSQKEAYKYAGGSPNSGAKSAKTKTLREAGLVTQIERGQYDFGLRDHLNDVLSGFTDGELDRVYDHLESEVYDHVMEGNEVK